MIILDFEDFKKLALENNKRIYYYIIDSMMELFFITEGIFTKTTIDLTEIENKEVFFGQKLFYGAIKLNFPITDGDSSKVTSAVKPIGYPLVKESQPAETDGGEDIQKTGVSDGNNP